MRNPAALFSSPQRRMSTVKIGSGCLVWVGLVEKVSKGWNSSPEPKPLSSLFGDAGEWLIPANNRDDLWGQSPEGIKLSSGPGSASCSWAIDGQSPRMDW